MFLYMAMHLSFYLLYLGYYYYTEETTRLIREVVNLYKYKNKFIIPILLYRIPLELHG